MPRWSLLIVFVLAAFLGQGGVAWAEPSLTTEISQVSSALALLKSQDIHKIAVAEIQKAELWIGQAQAYLAGDKAKETRIYLQRVQFMNQLIQHIMEEEQVKRSHQETQDRAALAENEAARARERRDATHRRMKELEAMGL